ncbi:Planctomycete cytochrome C [Thalassoglobus neptunius]|uniref:Planctomycete cytochrome C n=1 Tax=Thalassoglobus neptunius TaxID=1938619 RepID=A0A5C5VPY3_9PLAN|nr:PSD1 and planctomycete cytochrome C domain-containing protein [Thalassoglobus neptunius]TWT40093.1 Planctomycete cytochrome C [Thalassoglobus neptunius]
MNRTGAVTSVVLLVLCSLTAFVKADETPSKVQEQPTAEEIRFFENKIRPLLATHCYDCHGEETQEGGLRLDTLAGMLQGGNAGPAMVAGKPDRSLISNAISYRDNDLRMPPDERLTDQQIKDLNHWIESGSPHPESGQVGHVRPTSTIDLEAGRKHWAFQPIVAPDVPQMESSIEPGDDKSSASTSSTRQVAHPIDAFVLADLKSQGLNPLPRADKSTLIRRATFDLTGLPPTIQEINAFLEDDSADAFHKVVERLLNSPHYGERWGRHWLDVARYADSNGLDENAAHGNAWRYRDYVVQSFNRDKPYDEFLVEQLAGDLLVPDREPTTGHEQLIATGYLVIGPKVLAEVDESKMEMDIVDEQVDTVGRGVMGLTLGCARCHTHKFDPIEHADYYALAGIFKSTKTMETFKLVARWNEVAIPNAEELSRQQAHEQLVAEKKEEIAQRVELAKREVIEKRAAEISPTDVEEAEKPEPDPVEEKEFSETAAAELKKLRDELKKLEEAAPEISHAMAVAEGTVADTAIHIRGSHLTLGETVARGFPRVLVGDHQPSIPEDRSGRLEFARWLTSRENPLTSRVMVNRIWRWHFGKGIVATVDNFGITGESPTHPELLDWLAARFIDDQWSIKEMHRHIMFSETYQRASHPSQIEDVEDRAEAVNDWAMLVKKDPGNRSYGRFGVRRLEAEAVRDAILATSGELDRTIGGPVINTPNRTLVFNHTSQDATAYESQRRSLYIPIIRNHLYDMFQLFDYSDASVLSGDRDSSTTSPQALFLMNSPFMNEMAESMAVRILECELTTEQRIARLFEEAYGRFPTETESSEVIQFLRYFEEDDSQDPAEFEVSIVSTENSSAEEESSSDSRSEVSSRLRAWRALCQSILSSSEFLYLR